MKLRQLTNSITPNTFSRSIDPISAILANRGVEDLNDFFEHDWDSCVQSPYNLENVELAAKKIIHHLENSPTIAILVDCDCDGYTSAAVLVNYIEEARKSGLVGCDLQWNQNQPELKFIHHEGKIHGLADTDMMKQIRDLVKPALFIIPDASGTEEQYQALVDLGIDLVVLDHHDTDAKGNNDTVIVVNNQHSPNYANKSLSGVGVVWQTCRVMDDLLPVSIANNNLDLVAVGLVGDVMDLRSKETRFLVQEGLNNIVNPLLAQCLFSQDYKLEGELNPIKVGFNIAPLFNAIARIGSLEEKDMLFRALLSDANEKQVLSGNRNTKGQMVPLVVEAYRLITNAKSRQTRRQDKLMGMIDEVISDEGLLENKVLVITIGKGDYEEEHRGLAGLVANKFQSAYSRPCLILFQNDDGTYSGSGRAPSSIEAFADFRAQCEESRLCRYAMGHGQAFGLGITAINTVALQDYFNEKYEGVDVDPTYDCDFIVDADNTDICEAIEALSGFSNIWGQGLNEPLIALQNVLVGPGTLSLVGQQKNRPTLKFTAKNGVCCVKFGSSQEEFDSLCLPYDGIEQYYKVTVVGRASMNVWRDTRTPQLLIEDYEVHGVGYDF